MKKRHISGPQRETVRLTLQDGLRGGLVHTQRYQGHTRFFAKENLEFLIEEK